MRQAAIFVVISVVAVLVVFALSSFIVPQPTRMFQTFSERQMVVTTGIVAFKEGGTQYYQWDTTLRSLTKSPIVSIRAELNLSRMHASAAVSKFFVGLAVIGPNDPLPHNVTANMETTDLTPPAQGFFYFGQSFPEVVSVTFLNGTSTQMFVSAQVYSSPLNG